MYFYILIYLFSAGKGTIYRYMWKCQLVGSICLLIENYWLLLQVTRERSKKIFTTMTLNSSSTNTFITTTRSVSNLDHVACLQQNGNQQLAYVCVWFFFLILPFFFPKVIHTMKTAAKKLVKPPPSIDRGRVNFRFRL